MSRKKRLRQNSDTQAGRKRTCRFRFEYDASMSTRAKVVIVKPHRDFAMLQELLLDLLHYTDVAQLITELQMLVRTNVDAVDTPSLSRRLLYDLKTNGLEHARRHLKGFVVGVKVGKSRQLANKQRKEVAWGISNWVKKTSGPKRLPKPK